MPLINCPECQNEISDKAIVCPHCACPLKKSKHKKVIFNNSKELLVGLTVIGVLLIIGIALAISFNSKDTVKDNKPEKTSDNMYEVGLAALDTADDFINGKINSADAEEKLDNAFFWAEIYLKNDTDEVGGSLFGSIYENDDFINSYILFLSIKVSNKNDGNGTNDDVIEARNNLAKFLGKKKR